MAENFVQKPRIYKKSLEKAFLFLPMHIYIQQIGNRMFYSNSEMQHLSSFKCAFV